MLAFMALTIWFCFAESLLWIWHEVTIAALATRMVSSNRIQYDLSSNMWRFVVKFFSHGVCRCATGAVLAYWESVLLAVGPQKDWIKYSYADGPVHLVPEMDGTRIIGQHTHDFLQRVPGSYTSTPQSRCSKYCVYIRIPLPSCARLRCAVRFVSQ